MSSAETLQRLLDLAPTRSTDHWLEVACGPGLISRGLAPRVRQMTAADITPAMLEVGAAEAAKVGLTNIEFVEGDATALAFPDNAFDGVVTRFSLHHIPAPGRCVREMHRVVRTGGYVLIGDHLTDDSQPEAAWHQEIERLRDPSHWASLTTTGLHDLIASTGLELVEEHVIPFSLEYAEWLSRGTGGSGMGEIIAALLAERPDGAWGFRVLPGPEGDRLHLKYGLSLWRKRTDEVV